MLRFFATALAAILLAAGFAPLAAAANSQITTSNFTDAYVWITAYQGSWHTGKSHAWCVKPQTTDTHGVAVYIYDVRAEISHGGCQRHPILLDQTRAGTNKVRDGAYRSTYHATQNGSQFSFGGPL